MADRPTLTELGEIARAAYFRHPSLDYGDRWNEAAAAILERLAQTCEAGQWEPIDYGLAWTVDARQLRDIATETGEVE
jgi:hypothetical protein